MIEQTASVSAGIASFLQSSGLSSSPVRTQTGASAPDPVAPSSPRATTGTAGAVPLAAPATSSSESAIALVSGAQGISCVHTEDGTVILFDRLTGRAVSALTRVAAEAALRRLATGSVPVAGAGSVPVASTA